MVRVRDLHGVNLHEDEVIEFLCENGFVQLRDDFADRRSLAGPGDARDVDTGAVAIGDGLLEVRVDFSEFVLAARQGGRNGRDM